MTDWKDTTRLDRFAFEMLDPNDLSTSRGLLDGVVPRDSRLIFNYYSDTRVSGNLKVVSGNYVEDSLIRIHHYVDAWDYHDELGTFFVNRDEAVSKSGAEVVNMKLSSMLTRISADRFTWHYAIPAMRYSKAVLADVFDRFGVDFSIAASCSNARYGTAKIYEIGDDVLSAVFDVCDMMGARLDVDGRGVATVEPYIAPSAKSPSVVYDASAPDSIMYGEAKVTSDYFSVPNRAVAVYKDGDVEVSGYADVPSTSRMSRGRRGRRVTEVIDLDELSPATSAQAAQVARQRLEGIDDEQVEIEFDAFYAPMRTGDVATVRIGSKQYKAMLKARDVKLAPGMPTSNTFKVV